MAENTKIEWCHHSWSPWEGCTKVSAGCANCYAETRDKQYHSGKHWGANGIRKMMSESYWKQPLKWNRIAQQAGTRFRVFPSLCDPFEDRPGLIDVRHRLMLLIEATPNLDWLLLTKRPENIGEMVPVKWFRDGFPSNLWIGASVENQETADKRIPELLKVPAKVRFLSCEPLFAPLDISTWLPRFVTGCSFSLNPAPLVDWVIVGGECGSGARPMQADWVCSIRDQCKAANVPIFIKQMGSEYARRHHFSDPKGGDWLEWAAEFRFREFPNAQTA